MQSHSKHRASSDGKLSMVRVSIIDYIFDSPLFYIGPFIIFFQAPATAFNNWSFAEALASVIMYQPNASSTNVEDADENFSSGKLGMKTG